MRAAIYNSIPEPAIVISIAALVAVYPFFRRYPFLRRFLQSAPVAAAIHRRMLSYIRFPSVPVGPILWIASRLWWWEQRCIEREWRSRPAK